MENRIVEIRRVSVEEAARLMRNMVLDKDGEQTTEFCLLMSTVIWAGFIREKLACI